MASKQNNPGLPVLDRREFLDRALKSVGAVALGTYTITFLAACSSDSDSPTGPSGDNGTGNGNDGMKLTVDLSQPSNAALKTIGGTLALSGNSLDSTGLLLYRESQTTVKAYSRRCPHQGCTTGAFNNGISTCPCHSSQFNVSGSVVQGPALTGLQQYAATIEDDVVTIG
jgi:Rieske Fe-S protein